MDRPRPYVTSNADYCGFALHCGDATADLGRLFLSIKKTR